MGAFLWIRGDPDRVGAAQPQSSRCPSRIQLSDSEDRRNHEPGNLHIPGGEGNGIIHAMIYSSKSLHPGLIVQDPVRDSKGMVLLPSGVVLSESHISQILQRGIPAVSVTSQEGEEEMLERVEREKESLLAMFGQTGATPELEQLRRLLMERIDAG